MSSRVHTIYSVGANEWIGTFENVRTCEIKDRTSTCHSFQFLRHNSRAPFKEPTRAHDSNPNCSNLNLVKPVSKNN